MHSAIMQPARAVQAATRSLSANKKKMRLQEEPEGGSHSKNKLSIFKVIIIGAKNLLHDANLI